MTAAWLLLLACAARPAMPEAAPWTRSEYFLPTVLHADPDVGRLRQDWYADALARLDEPSFLELSRRPGEGYRFLWLRTWHPAVVVRLHVVGDLAVAEARRLDGRSRPQELGRLAAANRRTVSAADLAALQDALDQVGFWSLPTMDPRDPATGDATAEEGSRWVFEGMHDGQLQVVDRFSPDDPDLVSLGMLMLELAGVHPDPREVY